MTLIGENFAEHYASVVDVPMPLARADIQLNFAKAAVGGGINNNNNKLNITESQRPSCRKPKSTRTKRYASVEQ